MCHHSVWLSFFAVVASARDYVFPGCKVKFANSFESSNPVPKILVAVWNATTPVKVRVTQLERNFTSIDVPIPDLSWTPILVNMTEKLNVVLPGGSIYPTEASQETINGFKTKKIEVFHASSAIDCPQGLPYKTVGSRNWLGFPPTGAKGEAFLIMPTVDLKPQLHICGSSCHNFFICPSEDVDQLKVQKSGDNCSQLSEYHFYRLQFHFENRELKVISERKELGRFPAEDRDDIWISTNDPQSSMVVVYCVKGNCDDETTDLPQIEEDCTLLRMFALVLPYSLVLLVGGAWIIDCLFRRRQINELRAANNRQIPTVHFQNTPHSNAPTATHSTTPTTAGESVMTENDIYVSLDEIR